MATLGLITKRKEKLVPKDETIFCLLTRQKQKRKKRNYKQNYFFRNSGWNIPQVAHSRLSPFFVCLVWVGFLWCWLNVLRFALGYLRDLESHANLDIKHLNLISFDSACVYHCFHLWFTSKLHAPTSASQIYRDYLVCHNVNVHRFFSLPASPRTLSPSLPGRIHSIVASRSYYWLPAGAFSGRPSSMPSSTPALEWTLFAWRNFSHYHFASSPFPLDSVKH